MFCNQMALLHAATGLSAFFINIAVENFAGWKFAATFSIMNHSYFLALLVYVLFNGALVFSSAFIVTHFAPAAAGSGIPEIKGYLNGEPSTSFKCIILLQSSLQAHRKV